MVKHGPNCLEGPLFLSFPKLGQDTSGDDAHALPASEANQLNNGLSAIRWELVHRVRREIAQGTYETPEKWEAALSAFLSAIERG